MLINEFQFTIPAKVVYKSGAIDELGDLLKQTGIGKVLVVTDAGIAKAGFLDVVNNVLAACGVESEVFLDVEPNPSVDTVNKGAAIFNDLKFQGVIALGGGSPMDTAKAIAIKITNGGNVQDYEGPDTFEHDPLPVIAIPTTAGTGSEVTPFAVITDRARKYKLTIISPRIIPQIAILDPGLISRLPASIAASTGLDALTHAIESYVSLFSSPYSDAFAEKAIELIGRNLRLFVANRKNEEAAGSMLVASLFAGLAFTHARLGNAHAMAHPLGGYFDVPHGVANAILLPYIMDYNRIANPDKFCRIAKLMGDEESPQGAVEAIRKLNRDLGIPEKLSSFGVTSDAVAGMTKDAMKSGNVLANPRQTGFSEIEALYQLAI
ncbi:iron-containing alcohol dehydrogenase [Desulforhopalus singaporensis]|uniref:Alcohol dehydrogenase n=1 Tax=Desulforhopalus singaporensis TaxID=91360 RepID=A0A1H0T7B9_9BACT|nr:iron-containing alcohol dehydrogenase [Desulforhopalus singaporensis]SDP49884.1 alcohol dehydrogenase [Desulforhopalus singaporensis]